VLAKVTGDDGAEYEIRRGKRGAIYCTCPGWRYQKGVSVRYRSCKHMRRRPDLMNQQADANVQHAHVRRGD
jgi:hypothetical protein